MKNIKIEFAGFPMKYASGRYFEWGYYGEGWRIGQVFARLQEREDGYIFDVTSPTRRMTALWNPEGDLIRLEVSRRYSPRYRGVKGAFPYAPLGRPNLRQVLNDLPAAYLQVLQDVHKQLFA